jgi:hypothetical protein
MARVPQIVVDTAVSIPDVVAVAAEKLLDKVNWAAMPPP